MRVGQETGAEFAKDFSGFGAKGGESSGVALLLVRCKCFGHP